MESSWVKSLAYAIPMNPEWTGLSGFFARSSAPVGKLHRIASALAVSAFLCALGLATSAGFLTAQTSAPANPVASVNPFIGTGNTAGGPGNLFPGAVMPFGMAQLSPDTEDHGFGYHYGDYDIHGFSMTHMSGVGCANDGEVFFTATTGPVHTATDDIRSPYSHTLEKATPGFYEVQLLQWGIDAQLSATDRTGVAQFTFPAGKAANIVVPIAHTLGNTTAAEVQVTGDRQIQGLVENRAFCGNAQTYKVYFVMTFSRPFSSFGTWNGSRYNGPGTITAGSRVAQQSTHDAWAGAYATWAPESQTQTVTAKIAISYVDPQGAENNLKAEAEGKSFAQIRSEAEEAWKHALSVIDISGGSRTQSTVFYTALYHSLMMPSIFSDADGRYLGFDGNVHHVDAGHLVYANYSGWDIYRDEIPLLAMLEPERMEDMAQSIVLMYRRGGWIDRWPQVNLYTNVMEGSPLTVALATAWLDGLHGFDMQTAWEGMLKDATQAPPPGHPYKGESEVEWINELHYVPADKGIYGSVSRIQEDSIAYASLYRLAVDLGKSSDAKTLYERAQYYRNVFDPADRFFRPRNADGEWTPDFDPAENMPPHFNVSAFVEGTGWHYQWLEPTDMAWVINAMGRDLFNQRLTEFFDYKIPSWYGQYYNPYNETDLEAPFEFNFSGKPWESQRVVRRVLDENYTNSPEGIPGNDDCGAMSSWAVLSMMGIYTVDPTSLAYELVSPVFPRAVIHLEQPYSGKTFTIDANGASNTYIQSVELNGHAQHPNWISFHSIAAGGTLHFNLGAKPNTAWGSAASDVPPSLSTEGQ